MIQVNSSSPESIKEDTDLAGVLEDRRSMYTFLARIYEREVTTEFLKELSSKESPLQTTSIVDMDEDEFKEGFMELTSYLKNMQDANLDEEKLKLDVEYANLFLSVLVRIHPSESSYTTREHLVYDEPRQEVFEIYVREGVEKIAEFTEPEDHIAIEMQFMAYLCRKAIEANEQQNWESMLGLLKTQEDFVRKHLMNWTPKLTKNIIEKSNTGFYRGAAKITNAFLEVESDSIKELKAYVSAKRSSV
ncbi:MAG: molecular chaperone TorD family protein [Nitrososphaerota archaeon]|jgi:anaerobic sulfite reductase subunit A|nr:molecular chaperone TorD family protein [Nitrososphaerota archaeon]MDG6922928.1 molecular chaperone TorD family protein [Nitrososphaerota archaeon]